MSTFWDEWAGLIVPLLFIVIVILGLIFINYEMELHTCLAKTAEIGFPHKFDFWAGCRIFVDHRWIPLDNWYFKTQ